MFLLVVSVEMALSLLDVVRIDPFRMFVEVIVCLYLSSLVSIEGSTVSPGIPVVPWTEFPDMQ